MLQMLYIHFLFSNFQIIHTLEKAIEDQEIFLTVNPNEAIYYHSEIGLISGDFDCGSRGLDHNVLKGITNATWEQLIMQGTVLVPESNAYISDYEIGLFNSFNMERLPLNDNHITGYKAKDVLKWTVPFFYF